MQSVLSLTLNDHMRESRNGGKNEGRDIDMFFCCFFFFLTAGVQPAFSGSSLKLHLCRMVGVSLEAWCGRCVFSTPSGKERIRGSLLSSLPTPHIYFKGTNTREQPETLNLPSQQHIWYSCKGKLSIWLWPNLKWVMSMRRCTIVTTRRFQTAGFIFSFTLPLSFCSTKVFPFWFILSNGVRFAGQLKFPFNFSHSLYSWLSPEQDTGTDADEKL